MSSISFILRQGSPKTCTEGVVTKRAIIDVNGIVPGRNYDI